MAALLVAMVGCNKEPQQTSTSGTEDGKVYMQFSVNMLTTRSGTDGEVEYPSDATPDYEVGKDYENTISSIDIVLQPVRGGNSIVAENVELSDASSTANDVKKTYVASFSSMALTAGEEYQVYIYANCDAPVTEGVHDANAVSNASVASMTENNKFWMTNAYQANTKILPSDLSLYTQPQNPLPLGSHHVERSMARFDYKAINNNVYPIGVNSEDATTVQVTLTEAALINQSKAFYMLRRTSDDGLATGWIHGGVETAVNYVVDTDYSLKKDGYTEAQATNFDYHLTLPYGDDANNIAAWDWKSLSLSTEDSWTGTGDDDETGTHEGNYYIWQYAKENTIPATPTETQQNGISTGVVFKGKITATEDAPENIKTALKSGERIYVFENELYGTWNDVEEAASATDAKATLVAAYNKVKPAEGADLDLAKVAEAGFTGYSAVDEGTEENHSYAYYTYYYYWNRHNDNADNSVMGPMEFAVVRNNVYKLCVDKIAKYGHPTPPDNDPDTPDDPDPDPVDPEDPDEELNYYFTVTVKVLPWVVRVNHIEF